MQIVIDIPNDLLEKGNFLEFFGCCSKKLYDVIANGIPLPKCNQCKYYEGVHNVQGHAPCEYHKIGGVLWNWYCSQFEVDKEVSE